MSSFQAFQVGLTLILVGTLGGGCKPSQPPPQPPPTPVTVIKVTSLPIGETLLLPGKTRGVSVVEVRAQVDGILIKDHVTPGQTVAQGDLLFQIDPRPLQAKRDQATAEKGKAQAEYLYAQHQTKRVRALKTSQAVSTQDVEQAETAERRAQAALDAAKAAQTLAELNLDYTAITSPITGVASLTNQDAGALVSPGSGGPPLVTLTQLDPLYVDFGVSDAQWVAIQPSDQTDALPQRIQVTLRLSDGTPYPHPGTLTFVDARMDAVGGTLALRALFPNPQHLLKSGQFVQVGLHLPASAPVPVIPHRAVNQGPTGKYVFVQSAQGTADLRPIEGQEKPGNLFVVNRGLREGETVIVDGALKLRPGAPLTVTQTLPPLSLSSRGKQTPS